MEQYRRFWTSPPQHDSGLVDMLDLGNMRLEELQELT